MKTVLLAYGACLTIASLQVERFGWRHGGAAHRLLHVLSFAGLVALAGLSSKHRYGDSRQSRRVPVAVLAAVALGAGIELAQHLIYHNPYEWEDLRDDSLGAGAGAVMLLLTPLARALLSAGVRPKGSH